MVKPWRRSLLLVGISVLLGAVLELAPPLLVQKIVDEHLTLDQPEGMLLIASLYLGATAVVQAMGFVTEYLTAVIAQGVLRRLRVRLFAHLQALPISYYDRTPLGDTIRPLHRGCGNSVYPLHHGSGRRGGGIFGGWRQRDQRGHGADGDSAAGYHRGSHGSP
jgi:ABC-type multidrug transport system fused ATPase/permease subunit